MAGVTVARLEAVLGADTDQFDRAMNQSEGRMKSMGKAAALGGLAIAAGIGVGLKKSVDAAMESEKAQARLNQALAGAGISQDKYGAAIERNIQRTSKLAALDDEDLSDSFAKLVRATGDVTKATEGMNLAADIARARNISLEAATKMVERASIGNAAAFSRVGIAIAKSSDNLQAAKSTIDSWRDSSGKLSEAEDQKAKKLLDSARALDKQATAAKAFDEAQRRFANGAKEYGETAAGAQERFGVAVENLQEKIGSKLLPVLAKLAEVALQVISSIEKNWPKIMAVIGPVMERVREIVREVLEDVRRVWEQHGEQIMAIATRVFQAVRAIVESAMKVIQGVINVVLGIITGDWSRAWEGVKQVVTGTFDAIKTILTNVLPLMALAAKAIGTAILNGIINAVTGIAGKVWDLITGIGDRIMKGRAIVNGWGDSVGTWIKNAIVDAFDGIGSAIWDKIKAAIDWVRDKIPSLPKFDIPGIGDAFDPLFSGTSPGPPVASGAVDLLGANEVMRPFAQSAAGYGLRITSGLRPGAITANGTLSDHALGKALDVAGPANLMAAFFQQLIGNSRVKQAFYDPLGSVFGGKWNSYREGGHTDHVHVATYDKGGWLKPGLTLAYNGTGAPERVGGRGGDVHLHFHGDNYGIPTRQFFRLVQDGLRQLDIVQTGGRVLQSTPTLS